MSVIDSSQTSPASGIITGTFVDLHTNGDDFILDTNGTLYLVDPEGTDARNFNFSPGDTLEVRVDEFDGREIDSNSITRVAATTTTPATTATASTLNGFDGDRYLRENPDVAAAGVDPVQHFWNNGALEGRVPTLFDENFYLQSNPDVAAAVAANTVSSGWEHFRYHGAREGRLGSATGSAEFNQAIAVGLGNPAPTPPSNDPLTGSPMVTDRNVTGTLAGFWDDGDDFLLDVNGAQYVVDPEGTDARNLNLSVGDRLMVRVDEFDGREIDSSSITRLTDGAEPTPDSTSDPLTPDPLTNFSGQTVQGTVVRLTDEEDFLLDTPNGRFEVETRWDERQEGVLPVQPGQSLTVIGRFDDELSSLGVPDFEATQVILGDGSRLI